jgi:hypothetical protein
MEAMNRTPIIALLTDFGLADAYVGTMKGAILSICPNAQLIDLTHAIAPQNVRQAAYVLLTAYRYFPPHTIFLIVVDPGVGTARRAVAVETDRGVYVAPDNGVLSYVLPHVQTRQIVALQNPAYQLPSASQTFHGRDIFGPAAAHLANGVSLADFGPALSQVVTLPDPRLDISPSQIHGEILHVDHFGNLITSIGQLTWISSDTLRLDPQFGRARPVPAINAARVRVRILERTVTPVRQTYGDAPPGTLVALVGSAGQLEIGVNQGNAAQTLSAAPGDLVTVTLSENAIIDVR